MFSPASRLNDIWDITERACGCVWTTRVHCVCSFGLWPPCFLCYPLFCVLHWQSPGLLCLLSVLLFYHSERLSQSCKDDMASCLWNAQLPSGPQFLLWVDLPMSYMHLRFILRGKSRVPATDKSSGPSLLALTSEGFVLVLVSLSSFVSGGLPLCQELCHVAGLSTDPLCWGAGPSAVWCFGLASVYL